MSFVKKCIENGGSLYPLVIDPKDMKGPSLTNPSVFYDKITDKLLVNLRNINYTLYHSEKKKYEHCWGPLVIFIQKMTGD